MVTSVGYCFTSQLLELERRSEGSSSRVLSGAEEVVTPLVWQRWEAELTEHPDREWARFLVRGIRDGFRVGHEQRSVTLVERRGAMFEAKKHGVIVEEYLRKEVQEKRVWKVNDEGVQCSPFRVIPKKGKPGRWRLIVSKRPKELLRSFFFPEVA